MNNVFEYYMREYYVSCDDEFYLIMNYMKKNNDISSLILDGVSIDGIDLENSAITSINVNDNFMSRVNEQIRDDYLNIYFNNYEYMRGIFVSSVNNSNLSSSIKEKITNRDDIINAVVNTEYFENEYFMISDDTSYVLIDVSYNDQYNKISISNVVIEDIDILNVSINYTNDNKPNDEEVSNIISFIAGEFDGVVEEGSLVAESIDENNYNIRFKIVKNADKIVDDGNTVEIDGVVTDDNSIVDSSLFDDGSSSSGFGDDADLSSDFDDNSESDLADNLDINSNVIDNNSEMLE